MGKLLRDVQMVFEKSAQGYCRSHSTQLHSSIPTRRYRYWASVSFPTNSHFPSSLFFSATPTSSHHMDDDQDAYNAQEDDAPWPHDPNVFTESHSTLPVYLLVCSPDVTKAKKLTHCAFNTLVTCR